MAASDEDVAATKYKELLPVFIFLLLCPHGEIRYRAVVALRYLVSVAYLLFPFALKSHSPSPSSVLHVCLVNDGGLLSQAECEASRKGFQEEIEIADQNEKEVEEAKAAVSDPSDTAAAVAASADDKEKEKAGTNSTWVVPIKVIHAALLQFFQRLQSEDDVDEEEAQIGSELQQVFKLVMGK